MVAARPSPTGLFVILLPTAKPRTSSSSLAMVGIDNPNDPAADELLPRHDPGHDHCCSSHCAQVHQRQVPVSHADGSDGQSWPVCASTFFRTSLNLCASQSQMTHSIDSFITDSANSATALYTGKKSTVNALGVYVDSVSLFLHGYEPSHLIPHSPRTLLTTPKLKPSLSFSVVALVVLSELFPLLTLPTRLLVC